MEYTTVVIMLALLQYLWFGFRTGLARPKYGIAAPKVVGDETWERIFRVHQNTMEQLVVFVPALWTFSTYVSPKWGAGLGILFIVFRQIYSISYIRNPKKRIFPPSFLINAVLVIGTIVGIMIQIAKTSS